MEANELIVRQALAKFAAAVEALPMDKHAHIRADAAYADALGVLLSLVAPNSNAAAGAVKKTPDNIDRLSDELDAEAAYDRRFPPDGGPSRRCHVCGEFAAPGSKYCQVHADKPHPERRCRRCGCTEANCGKCAAKTGSPCNWVDYDLCSACVTAPIATLRTWPCAGGCGKADVMVEGARCVVCAKSYVESHCRVCGEPRIDGSEFCELHAHECVYTGCVVRVCCEGEGCEACALTRPASDVPTCTPEAIADARLHPAGCPCPVCGPPPEPTIDRLHGRPATRDRDARGGAVKIIDEELAGTPGWNPDDEARYNAGREKLAAGRTTPADLDRAAAYAESRCTKPGCSQKKLGSYLFCAEHQREEND